MAQGGFALLKEVAAAHLGNAAVQQELCGAVFNLAANADNQVRRFFFFVLYAQSAVLACPSFTLPNRTFLK